MATKVDPITLDIIENALKNARFEMDGVVVRISLSPVIREQHDEFPMICNERGQMIVGQFGSYIPSVVEKFGGDLNEGDIFVWNDPYASKGSISHNNDWCVMLPIFHEKILVGFSSIFGHMVDVGGSVPGSMPANARTIWEEGLRVPPVKIYDKGVLNQGVLEIMLNNSRTPDMNRADLMALIAGCRTASTRVRELCDRFGRETYMTACDMLLERTREAMRVVIQKYIPEEPVTFSDYVDDDGLGNGPFKMTLTIKRRGDIAVFDWTGTDPQAEGPINFHIHEGLCKLFFGVYMIMSFDPSVLFNEGFYDLFEIVLPEGSLLNPRFPAALSNRLNTHTRFFDCQAGALGKFVPQLSMAAGYGTSPHFIFSGTDKNNKYFQLMELLFGGVPGRPKGDGFDGHAWWPLFSATPIEYIENYYPVLVERYQPIQDSGGPGSIAAALASRRSISCSKRVRFPSMTTAKWCPLGASMAACMAAPRASGSTASALPSRSAFRPRSTISRSIRATASSSRPPVPAAGVTRWSAMPPSSPATCAMASSPASRPKRPMAWY